MELVDVIFIAKKVYERIQTRKLNLQLVDNIKTTVLKFIDGSLDVEVNYDNIYISLKRIHKIINKFFLFSINIHKLYNEIFLINMEITMIIKSCIHENSRMIKIISNSYQEQAHQEQARQEQKEQEEQEQGWLDKMIKKAQEEERNHLKNRRRL